MKAPFVAAVIATHQRAQELARLLCSLEKCGPALGAVVVTDNADDSATAEALERSPLVTLRVVPGQNLGCGGGLARAEMAALEEYRERVTHLWILDDDVILQPETLETLLRAMESSGAPAACPLVTDEEGLIGWFPGLLERAKLEAIRARPTVADFVARFGTNPIPFSWSTGVSLLVRKEMVEKLGPHRGDFWVRGEDLEFSLRMTHKSLGILVPETVVTHIPPASVNTPEAEFTRYAVMLQNIVYQAIHLPHSRRLLRTIPGNWLQFLRQWGHAPDAGRAAWLAFFHGALRGQPAGKCTWYKDLKVSRLDAGKGNG